VFRYSAGAVALGIGACAVGIGMSGIKNPFILAWATTDLGVARAAMLKHPAVTTVVQFVTQPVAAHYARRFGALRVMAGSLVATLVVLVPTFVLIGTTVRAGRAGFVPADGDSIGYYASSLDSFPTCFRFGPLHRDLVVLPACWPPSSVRFRSSPSCCSQ